MHYRGKKNLFEISGPQSFEDEKIIRGNL